MASASETSSVLKSHVGVVQAMSNIHFIANDEVTILQSTRNATNDQKVQEVIVIETKELPTVRNIEQVLQVVCSVRNTIMAASFCLANQSPVSGFT